VADESCYTYEDDDETYHSDGSYTYATTVGGGTTVCTDYSGYSGYSGATSYYTYDDNDASTVGEYTANELGTIYDDDEEEDSSSHHYPTIRKSRSDESSLIRRPYEHSSYHHGSQSSYPRHTDRERHRVRRRHRRHSVDDSSVLYGGSDMLNNFPNLFSWIVGADPEDHQYHGNDDIRRLSTSSRQRSQANNSLLPSSTFNGALSLINESQELLTSVTFDGAVSALAIAMGFEETKKLQQEATTPLNLEHNGNNNKMAVRSSSEMKDSSSPRDLNSRIVDHDEMIQAVSSLPDEAIDALVEAIGEEKTRKARESLMEVAGEKNSEESMDAINTMREMKEELKDGKSRMKKLLLSTLRQQKIQASHNATAQVEEEQKIVHTTANSVANLSPKDQRKNIILNWHKQKKEAPKKRSGVMAKKEVSTNPVNCHEGGREDPSLGRDREDAGHSKKLKLITPREEVVSDSSRETFGHVKDRRHINKVGATSSICVSEASSIADGKDKYCVDGPDVKDICKDGSSENEPNGDKYAINEDGSQENLSPIQNDSDSETGVIMTGTKATNLQSSSPKRKEEQMVEYHQHAPPAEKLAIDDDDDSRHGGEVDTFGWNNDSCSDSDAKSLKQFDGAKSLEEDKDSSVMLLTNNGHSLGSKMEQKIVLEEPSDPIGDCGGLDTKCLEKGPEQMKGENMEKTSGLASGKSLDHQESVIVMKDTGKSSSSIPLLMSSDKKVKWARDEKTSPRKSSSNEKRNNSANAPERTQQLKEGILKYDVQRGVQDPPEDDSPGLRRSSSRDDLEAQNTDWNSERLDIVSDESFGTAAVNDEDRGRSMTPLPVKESITDSGGNPCVSDFQENENTLQGEPNLNTPETDNNQHAFTDGVFMELLLSKGISIGYDKVREEKSNESMSETQDIPSEQPLEVQKTMEKNWNNSMIHDEKANDVKSPRQTPPSEEMEESRQKSIFHGDDSNVSASDVSDVGVGGGQTKAHVETSKGVSNTEEINGIFNNDQDIGLRGWIEEKNANVNLSELAKKQLHNDLSHKKDSKGQKEKARQNSLFKSDSSLSTTGTNGGKGENDNMPTSWAPVKELDDEELQEESASLFIQDQLHYVSSDLTCEEQEVEELTSNEFVNDRNASVRKCGENLIDDKVSRNNYTELVVNEPDTFEERRGRLEERRRLLLIETHKKDLTVAKSQSKSSESKNPSNLSQTGSDATTSSDKQLNRFGWSDKPRDQTAKHKADDTKKSITGIKKENGTKPGNPPQNSVIRRSKGGVVDRTLRVSISSAELKPISVSKTPVVHNHGLPPRITSPIGNDMRSPTIPRTPTRTPTRLMNRHFFPDDSDATASSSTVGQNANSITGDDAVFPMSPCSDAGSSLHDQISRARHSSRTIREMNETLDHDLKMLKEKVLDRRGSHQNVTQNLIISKLHGVIKELKDEISSIEEDKQKRINEVEFELEATRHKCADFAEMLRENVDLLDESRALLVREISQKDGESHQQKTGKDDAKEQKIKQLERAVLAMAMEDERKSIVIRKLLEDAKQNMTAPRNPSTSDAPKDLDNELIDKQIIIPHGVASLKKTKPLRRIASKTRQDKKNTKC